jgi:hypothetical protein
LLFENAEMRMVHISCLQAKQDQLEADGLFNPAFFGNQARGFLIRTSDFFTKSAFVACLWIRFRSPGLDLDSIGSVDPESEAKKKIFGTNFKFFYSTENLLKKKPLH